MTPNEFDTSIKKGIIPPICFVYGEEQFLVERAVNALLEKAIDSSLKDFNFNVFYGNESKGVDIIDAAQTLPMFSDRRAVLVKRADQLKADALEVILPYIKNPAKTTCLLLTGTKIDQRKKFFLEFKKYGELIEYKSFYEDKLAGFVQSEATAHGKPIESAAASLLTLLVGNNLQELSSQIEKLSVYAANKQRITVDDVKTMASSSKAFTAFELAKYLSLKDLPNSIRSLDALFLNGADAPMILGALTNHFRKLWRIRELLNQKMSQPEIGKSLSINAFFLGDMVTQARNFSSSEFKHIFDEFYRSDVLSKTGGISYNLLHRLTMGICIGCW